MQMIIEIDNNYTKFAELIEYLTNLGISYKVKKKNKEFLTETELIKRSQNIDSGNYFEFTDKDMSNLNTFITRVHEYGSTVKV